jgi:Holliday junction DNA helicase RuvA
MFSTIRGKLIEAGPLFVVVEAAGVGYKVFIAASTIGKLPDLHKEVFLYVSLVTREMVQSLYGFCEKEERNLFELLIDVSGIGPKIAMSLLGHLSPQEICLMIRSQDVERLIKVPGIGKKTAERLIMELKDKFGRTKGGRSPQEFTISLSQGDLFQDAMSALVNLGYNQSMAEKAVEGAIKNLSKEADLASVITEALKKKLL